MNNFQRGYNMNRPSSRQQGSGYMQNRPMEPRAATCPPNARPISKPLSQKQLLSYITEVSFAVVDMTLYLDTHPQDQEAIEYCNKHIEMREKALKEYAKHYGPLTIDTADDSSSKSWKWVTQPWPWEGGYC